MHREYLLVNNGRNGEAVKAVRECLPQLYVVPPFAYPPSIKSIKKKRKKGRTFIVEPVYPVDARALVVSPQDEKVFGVLDFVRQQ
jgi:hypothetical protein